MKLVGLAGPAGCGKDEIAKRLERHHNYMHLKFAATLYRAASFMLGIDLSLMTREEKEAPFEDPYLSRLGVTPRQVLQRMGTEFARDMLHPDIWVILMERMLHNHRENPIDPDCRGIVISDVRFENEAEMIRRIGGAICHVERPGLQLIPESGHASEQGIVKEPTDYLLPNTGSIGDLYELIDRWMQNDSGFLS